jgi:2-dehydropantoate 2-reductase
MKISIVGAGAIGGFLGTQLALAESNGLAAHQVSALARGATLGALQQYGWRMNTSGGLLQAPIHKASNNAADLGAQDLVIIAVKGQSLAEIAPQLAPLIGSNTLILPAMNGVPWWFCQGLQGFQGLQCFEEPLQSLDPTGVMAASIPMAQVLGCVVHASTSQIEPGLVQHKMGQGLIVGEPAGDPLQSSHRVASVVEALSHAGFDATHSAHIRYDIWYKLWGNMTMNPVSAITGATIDKILGDPLVAAFCARAMLEAGAIGKAIGCDITQTPADRNLITAKLGAFKTSMLQDVEAGRSIELDAIVGAVFEMGQRLQLPTDNIGAILGLTRVFAHNKNLY